MARRDPLVDAFASALRFAAAYLATLGVICIVAGGFTIWMLYQLSAWLIS